jgi:hypothetical protein
MIHQRLLSKADGIELIRGQAPIAITGRNTKRVTEEISGYPLRGLP